MRFTLNHRDLSLALGFQANFERGSPRVLNRQDHSDFHRVRLQDLIRARSDSAVPRVNLAVRPVKLASLGAFDFSTPNQPSRFRARRLASLGAFDFSSPNQPSRFQARTLASLGAFDFSTRNQPSRFRARRLASLGAFDFSGEKQAESARSFRKDSVSVEVGIRRSARSGRSASVSFGRFSRSIRNGARDDRGVSFTLSIEKIIPSGSTAIESPIRVGLCLRSRRADRHGYVGPHRERDSARLGVFSWSSQKRMNRFLTKKARRSS
jgi:hypothetical protein